MDTAAVMIRNLNLSYQDGLVVDDLTLGLNPQELGCLLGPSGCGKSTLLRSIASVASDGAEGEPRPGILIENLWGTPPGDLAARAAVLSRLDGLIDYSETLDDAHGHDADARTIRALIDSASGDVCEHLTSIAEAAHVSEDEIVASASSGSPMRCG